MGITSCTIVGHAPSIVVSQRRRVSCPYCNVGGAILEVEKGGGDKLRIEGVHDPRKCDSCGRVFRLNIRVVVEGVKIAEES